MRIDVFQQGRCLGGYHAREGQETRVGRDRANHIILPHPQVSRHHLTLFPRGGGCLALDSSTNGTWLEGRKVQKADLACGQELEVGPFTLRLGEDEPGWNRETELSEQEEGGGGFHGLVGDSPPMRELASMLRKVSSSSGTVLICGETGTGKELAARAVHDLSPRAPAPFVAINCGAISPDLVESELFGHERGAFTGASGARKGAFEQAQGGTLFLDEVGELSQGLQPKLLRVLETGEVRRVGAQGAVKVDVRVVAATHRDLKAEVARERFRADLLYRLFVLPLQLPPLRERSGDIPLLVRHFLGGRSQVTPEAQRLLLEYPWPGNVRELKNVLERACILRGGGDIQPRDLVFMGKVEEGRMAPDTMQEIERMYLLKALELSGGSIRAAARQLGMPKSTFSDRVRRYGIAPPGEEEAEGE